MAQLVTMPQLGSTMEEGTILKWLKQEGEAIAEGEPLLEIETDKASMEVESPASGIVRKIIAVANALVPIREAIAIIGTADEPIDALLGGTSSDATAAAPPASVPPIAQNVPLPTSAGSDSHAQVFLSPRAARLAETHGVSHAALAGHGTGPQGRIIERDILAYVAAQQATPSVADRARRATPLAARMADDLGVNLSDLATGLPGSRVRSEDVLRHAEALRPAPVAAPAAAEYTVTPFAGMRKRIADNVTKSRFTAPHVTLVLEADMTAAAELRARILPEVEKVYGVRLSFTDILIKATAKALADHPRVNTALVGDELRTYHHKNIGVAVALEEGLVVPVVKQAESKTIGAISVELKALVGRTRTGKFTPDDLSGGTFTITNLGTFGIDVFDPIIVPPQAAILGVGRIADKPVVINKEVKIRSMMNLCLSFDHRIIDGAPAAQFLQRLKELLENPYLILI